MCNRSGEGGCCSMSNEVLLKALLEKNQKIKELEARISQLVSDAGWEADARRLTEDANRGDTWK